MDQLELYDRLNTIAPQDITPAVLEEFFKDAALGVAPADVVETLRPREGVTVLRDRFGVPHVYGVTNNDTAFGAGYVGTQDRMFLQDTLRHVGAARVTEFLGPSEGNLAMDRAQLRRATFDDLMEHDDPEAPTTIDAAFPYNRYGTVNPSAVRLPDPGAPVAEGSGRAVSPLPFPLPLARRPADPPTPRSSMARSGRSRSR